MTTPSSDLARNVVVAVLAAVIIALGSAVIMHGRDIVEVKTRLNDAEKQIDLITHRVENLQNPKQ